jgi:hypothetical protein
MYGRDATETEIRYLTGKLNRLESQSASGQTETTTLVWTSLIRSLLSSNEFLYID